MNRKDSPCRRNLERERELEGFTLIELAIELVVVGLVAGGVLVGRDMIEAAKIRSELHQLDRFRLAENMFKDAYNALPGDIITTTARRFKLPAQLGGWGDSSQVNGNGHLNGIHNHCGGVNCFGFVFVESALYFLQMSDITCKASNAADDAQGAQLLNLGLNVELALTAGSCGLVSSSMGPGTHFPYSKINGQFGIIPVTANRFSKSTWFILNGQAAQFWLGTFTSLPSLSPSQASAMDLKVDDGIPSSGTVRAFKTGSYGQGTVHPSDIEVRNDDLPANGCVVDAAGSAYVSSNEIKCKIIVKK